MNAGYVRYEIIRLFRNRQNFLFSMIIPLVIFFAIAGPSGNSTIVPHVTVARYYYAGMLAFATLSAVLSGGARIAMERQVGWNRQLRLTPLRPGTYLRTKVVTSYLMAIASLALLTVAALAIGVRFGVGDWLQTVGLVLVALIPFAALGVMIGHLIKGDTMGPVLGLGISLFAILGGAYFPIGDNGGFMHYFVRAIPSFWLVQAGKVNLGGQSWTVWSWLVIAVWAVLCGSGAVWAYRRDTARS